MSKVKEFADSYLARLMNSYGYTADLNGTYRLPLTGGNELHVWVDTGYDEKESPGYSWVEYEFYGNNLTVVDSDTGEDVRHLELRRWTTRLQPQQ